MSITPVGSNQAQTLGNLLLQQLMDGGSTSQGTSSTSGLPGDLLTLSSAGQQLAKAPSAVTGAMTDLLSDQKDVQGDLAQLKTYFGQNPQMLASVLSSLQGGAGAYGVTSSLGSNATLLTALMNGQSNASDPSALLTLLGNSSQDSLFTILGGNDSSSDTSSPSLLG